MKKILYILLPLLLGALCLPVAAAERKPLPERKQQERVYFFHEGKRRAVFGDGKGAAYCFGRALRADPDCDACHYELAGLAAAANRSGDAIAYARAAFALDTGNVWYALRVAQLLALAERYAEAQVYYEKTLALNPRLQDAYAELLMVYDRGKQYEEAVHLLTRFQQRFGVDEASLLPKQSLLYRQGKLDEALAVTHTLTDMYPSEQRYWLMLAEQYAEREGAREQEAAALRQAAAVDSTTREYLMAMIDHHRRAANFDGYFAYMHAYFAHEAATSTMKLHMLDFLQQFPFLEQSYLADTDSLYAVLRAKHSYQAELLYARYLMQTRRADSAFMVLREVTAHGAQDPYLLDVIKKKQASKYFAGYARELPAYYASWGLYFDLLMVGKGWSLLEAEADIYDAIFADRLRTTYLKGLAHFQEKRYAEALHYWLQAEKAATPADTALLVLLYTNIGDAGFAQKDFAKTDKYYAKALRIDPNNMLTLNNYAYYLSVRKKRLSKALAMSRRSIDAEPDNATYLDTYAWILYQMGRYAEAKRVFQRALVHGGNEEGVILEHYGDVLYALGEVSNAQIYWQRALEKGNDTPELRRKLERHR